MTDIEDSPDSDDTSESKKVIKFNRLIAKGSLEEACIIFGRKNVYDAYNTGIPHEVLLQNMREVANQHIHEKQMYGVFIDFFIDRYVFHSRHMEKDKDMAVYDSHVDAFEYLLRVENALPFSYNGLVEDWRVR